jgi:hypothetical protein
MNQYTVVIIATKGRPEEVSNLLETLARQTIRPNKIVVSACEPNDIAHGLVLPENAEVLFGPPGLPAQRNRALALVRGKCDIVVFFDDDFIPSRYWIEHLQMLFATKSDVVGVTGQVLADGILIGGLERSDGQSVLANADSPKKQLVTMHDFRMQDRLSVYGCNMAFRATGIRHLKFDERLVLYGWLEDRDFALQAKTEGRIIWTDAVWGVHLGTTRVRLSGLRFGYSQVVNPWYLMKKGTMTPMDTCGHILRGLTANTSGIFFPNSHVDRWGRLKGNLIGIKEIMLGRWAPERISEL